MAVVIVDSAGKDIFVVVVVLEVEVANATVVAVVVDMGWVLPVRGSFDLRVGLRWVVVG